MRHRINGIPVLRRSRRDLRWYSTRSTIPPRGPRRSPVCWSRSAPRSNRCRHSSEEYWSQRSPTGRSPDPTVRPSPRRTGSRRYSTSRPPSPTCRPTCSPTTSSPTSSLKRMPKAFPPSAGRPPKQVCRRPGPSRRSLLLRPGRFLRRTSDPPAALAPSWPSPTPASPPMPNWPTSVWFPDSTCSITTPTPPTRSTA